MRLWIIAFLGGETWWTRLKRRDCVKGWSFYDMILTVISCLYEKVIFGRITLFSIFFAFLYILVLGHLCCCILRDCRWADQVVTPASGSWFMLKLAQVFVSPVKPYIALLHCGLKHFCFIAWCVGLQGNRSWSILLLGHDSDWNFVCLALLLAQFNLTSQNYDNKTPFIHLFLWSVKLFVCVVYI